jgi:hypothetical protein
MFKHENTTGSCINTFAERLDNRGDKPSFQPQTKLPNSTLESREKPAASTVTYQIIEHFLFYKCPELGVIISG